MADTAERAGHRAVLRQVARLLVPLGFLAGRASFFVRRREWVAEFVHLHKYSFSPGYRVHLGIRVLNDVFPAAALNGPDSHAYTCPGSPNGSRYELKFAPPPLSPERCAAEVARWCMEVGEPWFARFASPEALVADDSPLDTEAREQLRLALAGNSDPARVAASERLLA
jgi:hypothetical protein